MGIAADEDEHGNLLARIPGRTDRTVLLCAHIDTVETEAPIEPVLVDGGWENEHDGILGADNKAALAVILEVARRATVEGSPVGHRAALHRRRGGRAGGRQGVRRLAPAVRLRLRLRPRDLDRRGRRVLADRLPARGRVPRQGRARRHPARGRPQRVLAAARAIGSMPLGRIDDGDDGQRRLRPRRGRHDQRRARALPRCWPRRARSTRRASRTSCRGSSTRSTTAPRSPSATSTSCARRSSTATRCARRRPSWRPPRRRCSACGYEPRRIASGGGSDANALQASGFPCICLANGTERNHEPTERVSVVALEGMLDVALVLLEEAAAA